MVSNLIMRPATTYLFFAGLTACGSGDVLDSTPPAQPPSNLDLSAATFKPDQVLDIAITLDPADWDKLRYQTRSILDIIGSSCLQPPESPFTYFPADVTIDGVTVTNVALRKKGFFGSLDNEKPSLKIKFNEYVAGQRYSGLKEMTLNNDKSDPSHIHQCLGYQLFADAGVPAPRCNFARVSVNGTSLGVFTHVEAISKQLLSRFFTNDEGNLYEGALSDFRTGWVDTFQMKNDTLTPDRSDIESMVPVLNLPDNELLAALEPRIDTDSFVTFWAMELLLAHADGYSRNTNNFYLYHDPTTDLLWFIPWGIDNVFIDFNFPLPWETQTPPTIIWAQAMLVRRLYTHPDTQPVYLSRLQELLDAVWDEAALTSEINRMQSMLLPHIESAKRTDFNNAVQAVRTFVNSRRATIESALAQFPPAWAQPPRDPWCVDVIGDLTGDFSTTWDTLQADAFASGTGTLSGNLNGSPIDTPQNVGANSGIDPNNGEHVIQIVAWMPNGTALVAHLGVDPALLAPGASIPIDWIGASGYLAEVSFPANQPAVFTLLGLIGDGVLELDQASTTPGAPIVGRLNSPIYESIF